MASARITHKWADGDTVEFEITLDPSYPDAVDEARVQVQRMYREAISEEEPSDGFGGD